MRITMTTQYGGPDVLSVREAPLPDVGPHDLLVQVHATPVTAGDRRLRAADFPSFTAVIGRLMFGLLRPRRPVQGTNFAGRVVQVGAEVTRFAVGDDVFGAVDHGAYAEFLAVSEDAAVAPIPEGTSYEEAAGAPYGAATALHFLRDQAQVQPGERVLILGASGGVGRFAVQIARHLGAEVTSVGSQATLPLLRELGSHHVLDYATEDFTQNGQTYDVIFDLADASGFRHSQGSLTPTGRYVSVYMSVDVMWHTLRTSRSGGQRALFGIAMASSEQMADVAALLASGGIRPVVAETYGLEDIAQAHARAGSGEVHGEVLVTSREAEVIAVRA